MAVGANDLAPLDLPPNPGKGPALGDEDADLSHLRANVIELEYSNVRFAAIGARVRFEIGVHELACHPPALTAGGGGLLSMQGTAGAKVRPEAVLAPPLTASLRVSTERRKR
jgi:hypothetical protein